MATFTDFFDGLCSLNEIHSIIIVFREASCNCQDVEIEDNVFWKESSFFHKQIESSFAN